MQVGGGRWCRRGLGGGWWGGVAAAWAGVHLIGEVDLLLRGAQLLLDTDLTIRRVLTDHRRNRRADEARHQGRGGGELGLLLGLLLGQSRRTQGAGRRGRARIRGVSLRLKVEG